MCHGLRQSHASRHVSIAGIFDEHRRQCMMPVLVIKYLPRFRNGKMGWPAGMVNGRNMLPERWGGGRDECHGGCIKLSRKIHLYS